MIRHGAIVPFLRPLLLTACFALPSHAETDLGQRIADLGLAGAIADLEALETPTPSDAFALSASHFLRGIERSFQTRYHYGLTENEVDIPGLGVELDDNPNPSPFDPEVLERLFTNLQTDMAQARGILPAGEAVSVTLNPQDLWFDINANGQRDRGEGFVETAMAALISRRDFERMQEDLGKVAADTELIHFDLADTYWLEAYTHLMSGTADMVLAFDPTSAITEVYGANLRMFGPPREHSGWFMDDREANLIAAIIAVLETQPDANRTQAAHRHFLAMMEANTLFWQAVGAETDNANEWIPNPNQTAALPIEIPSDIGPAWQAVLADARAVLTGDLLIPHPRSQRDATRAPVQGINIAAWMQDPVPVDIVGYIHGHALEPYFETGPVFNPAALEQFADLTGGNFGIFMIWLN
ncbi:MAG: hypothetical protein AAF376_16000 [Pseudomonadota bacterium]